MAKMHFIGTIKAIVVSIMVDKNTMIVSNLEKTLEQIAEEFETHEDFSECRHVVKSFDVCIGDGLNEFPTSEYDQESI